MKIIIRSIVFIENLGKPCLYYSSLTRMVSLGIRFLQVLHTINKKKTRRRVFSFALTVACPILSTNALLKISSFSYILSSPHFLWLPKRRFHRCFPV